MQTVDCAKMKTLSKSFVYSILFFAISCISLTPFIACSNSDGIDYAGWEYYNVDSEDNALIEPQKQGCFNSFRLPDLQSIACKKQFYSNDTVTEFPQSGFFQNTFTIVFPNKKPLNCETGGKVPTAESPMISAIEIDSSTTIRCADISAKSTNNEIIRTYILEKAPDIATVFITTDPNSLFDPDTGIYMEGPSAEEKIPHYGANYWLDKEIPIFIELLEPDKNKPAFAKFAGLKIFGNYSRANAKKSVAITFREKYGDKRLNYTLFPEFPELKTFKSFVLRNFGNNFGKDYIRDRLVSSLSEGLDVDYQRGRYTILYYNSKYFGIHDLRERSNEYYFETHYKISHKNINLIETSMAKESASAGSADDFQSLMKWLESHHLDNEENYNYIISKIDINNLINYMQVEMFAYNRDWPGNNQKKWKYNSSDATWKWFLYDFDLSFDQTNKGFPVNIFEFAFAENSNIWQNAPKFTYLFRSLLKNKTFKASFINRMTTLIQTNYESSRILTHIDKLISEIEREIPRDQKRWSLSASTMDSHLEKIKLFAKNQPSLIITHLQEYFKLNEPTDITFSVNGPGTVLVHGFPIKQAPLTIHFFKKFPVTISAIPKTNHSWHKWSDGDTNATRMIWPEQTDELIAIFK